MKKLFLSLSALAIVSLLQAQTNLKLNPEKNTSYHFQSVSSQDMTQTVNGMDQNTNTSSTTAFSIKMLDATPAFMVMEARFDSIITRTNAMGRTSVINSGKEGNMASQEAADVMTAVMNRLCKNPLFIKMDATGKVIEIVNHSMLSDMVLKDTGLITGPAAPVLKTQVVNSVSPDALKPMIEAFTYNLPAREVKAGDSWTHSSPVNSGGMNLVVQSDFSLENITGTNAVVSAESSIKASENAQPLNYGGATINYNNLSGMGKSQLTVDSQTGLIKKSSARMHITGNLNVSAQGMNMQIPLVINSQSELTAL